MTEHNKSLYKLIVEIRGAFNDLRAFSDALNEDFGITAAMRAVVEFLNNEGQATVPQIAKAKNVSRQNIQQLSDQLVEKDVIEYVDNPDHKRSKFLRLTQHGLEIFAQISERETFALRDIAVTLEDQDVKNATAMLRQLRAAIS